MGALRFLVRIVHQALLEKAEEVVNPQLARGGKLDQKFAAIDRKSVINCNLNWSPSPAHQNDEVMLVIRWP